MPFITNAKIRSTMLGFEDHGILSCMLNLEWEGSGQGFGGYAFDRPVFNQEPDGPTTSVRGKFVGRRGAAFGAEFIRRLLDTLKVDKWEDLPGKYVRIRKEDEWGTIQAIGHITENRWFDPKVLADEFDVGPIGR